VGKKYRRKCIRIKKEKKKMVLGKDIRLEEVTTLMEKALIGHFVGKIVKSGSLRL
jgi:hypothetical protein